MVASSYSLRVPFGRRRLILGGLAAGVLGLTVFLRSTPDAFPYGDSAVTEIYVLHALRGFLKLGPYSQFNWHHPGPLYFYLLVPFYMLAGERTIGLAAGALAINFVSVATIGWIAARHVGRPTAAALVLASSIYLWRADGLVASIWNPHIVVLPLVALIVICSALAAGDRLALPLAVAVGSFLAQTNVATVPCTIILICSGITAAAVTRHGAWRRERRLLVASSIALAILLWVPPIVDELTRHPGNLTRLWRFFVTERQAGQPSWPAFLAWADMTTAVVRPQFHVSWGAAYVSKASIAVQALALGQFVLLMGALRWAWKAEHRFLAFLCALQLLASAISGLSITRIQGGEVGDYQVFWISGLGALHWATLAAVTVTLARHPFVPLPKRGTYLLFGFALGTVMVLGVHALRQARAYAVAQHETDGRRKIVSLAVERYIEREQVRRPLFHIAQNSWLDAACVILHVYRRHSRIAVEGAFVTVFGEALSANGREDVEIQIADSRLHWTLSSRPGDRVIAAYDGLFVHLLSRKY